METFSILKSRRIVQLLLVAVASTTVALFPLELTVAQQAALAIFTAAITLWVTEAIPLHITALLVLFLEVTWLTPVLKQSNPSFSPAVFYAPFFSDIIALFLGGLLLAEMIKKYHIDVWVTSGVVRLAGSRVDRILLSLMLTIGILSMWMSNTAATALGLILVQGLTTQLKRSGSDFSRAFYLGIPFAANLGGMGTPVGTPPNAIAMAALLKHGHQVTFAKWTVAMAPLALLSIVLVYKILKIFFKAPQKPFAYDPQSRFSFERNTKLVIFVFFLTVTLWLTSGWHGIPDGAIALLPVILGFALGLLEERDFKHVSWDILFLVGGGLALSVALEKAEVNELLLNFLPNGSISLYGAMIVFSVIGLFFSTVMSNTATASIVIPMTFLIAGLEPEPIVIATAAGVSAAMALPVSTPPNALAYGSGEIEMADMIKVGLVTGLVSLGLIWSVGYFYWKILGLF